MKYLLHLSRILVGNLFIFSGIVKANDPLGFSYKLEEYFVEFGMDWAWLHAILVPKAAAICILEIVLGVAVLFAYRMKLVTWILLLMIVFFTFLTGASAIFEIVRSCGCFGDAIPLTPWESFYKDLVLLFFILILFWKRNEMEPSKNFGFDLKILAISLVLMVPLSMQLDWWFPFEFLLMVLVSRLVLEYLTKEKAAEYSTIISLVISVLFSILAIEFLPFKDFRPYAIGKNMPEQMTLPPYAKPPVYENVLVYKNKVTGETKTFVGDEYNQSKIWENKDWEWQSTESELIEEGDVAKITDLSILDHNDREQTDEVLAKQNALWIVCYDLGLSSTTHIEEINKLVLAAQQKGIEVYCMSSAGTEQALAFRKENKVNWNFMVVDGIVLKTMIRSNPGLMQVKSGTVVAKWHENSLPNADELIP